MIATIINALAVLVGGVIGLLFRNRISSKIETIIFDATGIITLVVGVANTLALQRPLFFALSLTIGGITGYLLKIEHGIYNVGEKLKQLFVKKSSTTSQQFAHGFLTASLLFCVGPLSIIGSLQAGLDQNFQVLLTKSVLDGSVSILLAASLGSGVLLALATILLYQGGITLFATTIAPFFDDLIASELNAVGGALLIMIAINLLKLKKIETGNYLPALLIIVLLTALFR